MAILREELNGTGNSVPAFIFENEYQIGHYLAEYILKKIYIANSEGRNFLLGCPSGRSLQSTYDCLGKKAGEFAVSLENLFFVMMDEYVIEKEGQLQCCSEDSHFSCVRYANKEIFVNINKYLPEEKKIRKENIWFPDVAKPEEYEKKIAAYSGIDIFLAASGASDGHVAFNPPGSEMTSKTRIIELGEKTRLDNMSTFPEFKSFDEVPKYGVSVGLSTIANFSKEVFMVIHGTNKKFAVNKLKELKKFDEDWPASFIYECNNAILITDRNSFYV